VNPSFPAPFRQRLAGVYAEIVQRAVAALRCELGSREPAARELCSAVAHVLAAENAESEHFLGRQFGTKLRMEVAPGRRSQLVPVALLHSVINGDRSLRHAGPLRYRPNLALASTRRAWRIGSV